MSSLYDTIVNYLTKYKNESNSNVTLQTLKLCDQMRKGHITLKWWKEHNILFILDIYLESVQNAPKNVLTNTINELKNNAVINSFLHTVKFVGVANTDLVKKLTDNGWTSYEAGIIFMCI
jgi:hypothetical protein